MDEDLLALEAHLNQAGGTRRALSADDLEFLLAWAMRLAGAGYGYLRADEVEIHNPKPSLVSLPETPWPGVSLPYKACLAFAAQTRGSPLVFPTFPPGTAADPSVTRPSGEAVACELGARFVACGGRERCALPSPGSFLVAPLRHHGRYAGILLDGSGRRYGTETSARIAGLLALADRHGGPWPDPEAILGPSPSTEEGEFPVLEFDGRRIPMSKPVTIGQDPRSEIRTEDDLTSRRHAMVVPLVDGDVMVIDLRSSNGTFVNGERIETRILAPGDVVHTSKRNWSVVFRRVARYVEDAAPSVEANTAGNDLTRDRGRRLLSMVEGWAPRNQRSPLSEVCEMVALQLGLTNLTVLWKTGGRLRYTGAVVRPSPGPATSLDPTLTRLVRAIASGSRTTLSEGGAGLAPLKSGLLGESALVGWTHPESSPRPDGALIAGVIEAAVSGPETRFSRPDDAGLELLLARSRSTASGADCARLVREIAAAGFPSEAVERGRELARRFLEADEVEAALREVAQTLE